MARPLPRTRTVIVPAIRASVRVVDFEMGYGGLVELTVAFIVFCADSVGEDPRRPVVQRLVRAVLWPITLTRWFTHRNLTKLARFGAVVWFLVTTGWLLSLERDRIHTPARFLLTAEATMAFVVYCVDALSPDYQRKPIRRMLRSGIWIKPLTDYLRDEDSVKVLQASLTTWLLLTTGWLLTLEFDRIATPLSWITR